MRKVTVNLYKLNELSKEARSHAIASLCEINIDCWDDSIKDDAKSIGCDIYEYSVEPMQPYCCMEFEETPTKVIDLILDNHGEYCETYKLAAKYKNKLTDERTLEILDALIDFKVALQRIYAAMLVNAYNYSVSEQAIIDTIEGNDYDFTKNGQLFDCDSDSISTGYGNTIEAAQDAFREDKAFNQAKYVPQINKTLLEACKKALIIIEAESEACGIYKAHTELIRTAIEEAENKS